jgi:meiotically up-regulated gene 157 (Mug157) protein
MDTARDCSELSNEIENALREYAIFNHPTFGQIYAYEVDGFGSHYFNDDANVPSLLGMGYVYCVIIIILLQILRRCST